MKNVITSYILFFMILSLVNAKEREKKVITLENLPIIITHAVQSFDTSLDAKKGISDLVKDWDKGQIISLYRNNPYLLYIGKIADEYIYSSGGEFRANFKTDEVILVGGFMGYNIEQNMRGCLTNTIADTIMFHSNSRKGHNLTINLIADAMYYYKEDSYHDEDLLMSPSNWSSLLLNPFDTFFDPYTIIGNGTLPPVKGNEIYYWPPENIWSKWYGNRLYNPSQSSGHITNVSILNYSFTLLYNGFRKEVLGQGKKNVTISVWSDVSKFKNSLVK